MSDDTAYSRTVEQLVENINTRIPDNNAGQISAKDVKQCAMWHFYHT